ncbi:GNAT family N-acetyltransferase [Vibrio crassostreae]|uniref:GNAT family N-acetyltransferase n=1 Tax=Vibrio crassostreae TaxID=246167 RepID=UPI001B308FCD|nr:GNAT family N-acetyltransferase [Vibrio crassostreae]CAK1835599.1 GNAT family N-acetyltransferase [Vibrio crassostreae]CAK1837688.1 GNAT family N-acetyltransferase [Vibrio crassostreae]CAK1840033.1 GNAT family N-acetyltransferase [Vibrio crassostreae]CAK1844685.1 GNAT family N-acetyltransferase [Vibrio crassostreae]CAK1848309.1 GNAT family N-acetyltransferase [Vibrio crassostreae]
MEYTLDTDPSDSDINEVRAGLIKHNTPFLEGIPKSQVGYYAMEEVVKVGGVIADLWGNWLLIKFLWVDDSMKGKQVGSQLLQRLEEYAQSQGCTSSLVDTLSFQAEPFYEKHGYQCQMVLENYPLDSSLAFLTKSLTE